MIHLLSVGVGALEPGLSDRFPLNIAAIKALPTLEFGTPITFLVGENGSGKSTLLEAVALAAHMIAAGSDDLDRDRTLESVRQLAAKLKLSWHNRTRKGFFLRAEDYFGYAPWVPMGLTSPCS